MLTYAELKRRPATLRSLTGLTPLQFDQLYQEVAARYKIWTHPSGVCRSRCLLCRYGLRLRGNEFPRARRALRQPEPQV